MILLFSPRGQVYTTHAKVPPWQPLLPHTHKNYTELNSFSLRSIRTSAKREMSAACYYGGENIANLVPRALPKLVKEPIYRSQHRLVCQQNLI